MKGRVELKIGGKRIDVDGDFAYDFGATSRAPEGIDLRGPELLLKGSIMGIATDLGRLVFLLMELGIPMEVENLADSENPERMVTFCPAGTSCWVKLEATRTKIEADEGRENVLGYYGFFGRAFFSKDGRFLGLGLYE